jgi:hypothetical protein
MGQRGMYIGVLWESRKERRLICRCVDNIKMSLGEVGRVGMDWIDLAQDGDQWKALVNTAMNLRVS